MFINKTDSGYVLPMQSQVMVIHSFKQGGGGICPHKNDVVGALPPQRSAAGHVNLTQQLSPCSMGQHGTVALVGFKATV